MNNRTDQSHTTFLNCLRDWNDPYLHGQKPVKGVTCSRCENCGCRLLTNNNTHIDLNSTFTTTPATNTPTSEPSFARLSRSYTQAIPPFAPMACAPSL